jgi:hypothetical protein
VHDAHYHGLIFWIRLKVICNLREEINVNNRSLSVEWFSRVGIVDGNFIYPLWLFLISQQIRVKVFQYPHLYFCAQLCWI